MRSWRPMLLVALAMGLYVSPAAHADVFGPISLVSAGPTQQADYAHDAVISGDGDYVAFDGSFGGRTGVWRRDLRTGLIEAVAAGEKGTPAGSAQLPSISADGRFVAFTTTAQLSAEDVNHAPDVYVRDMELGEGPGAYTLASAADGSTAGLAYSYSGGNPVFEEQNLGSVASGRTALSADGRVVAFVTTATSNLANPAAVDTPPLQVAVRNLDTDSTQLVSARYDPATGAPAVDPESGRELPVSAPEGSGSYGAVDTGSAVARSYELPLPYETTTPIGASISADGTTVAWMGTDLGQQVPLLADETVQPKYVEPLWRRIADGPAAPTRRITGGSDPLAPSCIASGELVLPLAPSASDPCQGPFQAESAVGVFSGAGDTVPQLSADGYTVAFVVTAPLVSLGSDFGVGVSERNSDVYVANMHPGLTRVQALRPLTELASSEQTDLATDGRIIDLGISPSGTEIAFTTKRTQFPLGSPAFVSAPAAVPGMLELFDVDLGNDTLTRVTGGFEGGASEHPHPPVEAGKDPFEHVGDGALSPSFSDDGNTLAFSSTASNLAYGDGNTPPLGSPSFDGSDAFVVHRTIFGSTAIDQQISPPPAGPAVASLWKLGLTTRTSRDGRALLYVTVPGAGSLRAGAQAAVRVRVRAKRARRLPHGARGVRTSVRTRTVATRSQRASRAGVITMTLALAKPYAALDLASGGLSATVTVTFTAPHRPTLHASIPVTFVRVAKHARGKPKGLAKAKSKRSSHGARGAEARS